MREKNILFDLLNTMGKIVECAEQWLSVSC